MASKPQIIQFDYDFSPYSQKTRLLLLSTNTPFNICPQPAVLPRPDLTNLGITFRRMPILAIGKDIFADSALILQQISKHAVKPLSNSESGAGNDAAFASFGAALFQSVLPLVPASFLTDGFVKDRASIFPILGRSDFKSLRPSALGAFRAQLDLFENRLLQDQAGPFINGKNTLGLEDLHLAWVIKWALFELQVREEAEFGEKSWPKVYKWLSALPAMDGAMKRDDITGEQAKNEILKSDYVVTGLGVGNDLLDVKGGEKVSVESDDATPGSDPQIGKLIGLDTNLVSLELENGIHIHFPRVGYVVKKA